MIGGETGSGSIRGSHQEAWIAHVGNRIGVDCHRHIEPDPATGLLGWTDEPQPDSEPTSSAAEKT